MTEDQPKPPELSPEAERSRKLHATLLEACPVIGDFPEEKIRKLVDDVIGAVGSALQDIERHWDKGVERNEAHLSFAFRVMRAGALSVVLDGCPDEDARFRFNQAGKAVGEFYTETVRANLEKKLASQRS